MGPILISGMTLLGIEPTTFQTQGGQSTTTMYTVPSGGHADILKLSLTPSVGPPEAEAPGGKPNEPTDWIRLGHGNLEWGRRTQSSPTS